MPLLAAASDWLYHLTIPASHATRRQEARDRLDGLRHLAGSDESEDRALLFYRLRQLDPLVFEELVLLALADRGNRVRRNRRYSGDGGMDGRIWHMCAWCPVQVKRYSGHIDPAHVAALAALMRAMRAPAGWFIHTGRTGKLARETARADGNIRLISGDLLRRLIAGT